MSNDTFTCEVCGDTFIKGWSEGEAVAEKQALFGDDTPLAECAIVCENCFKRFDVVVRTRARMAARQREVSDRVKARVGGLQVSLEGGERRNVVRVSHRFVAVFEVADDMPDATIDFKADEAVDAIRRMMREEVKRVALIERAGEAFARCTVCGHVNVAHLNAALHGRNGCSSGGCACAGFLGARR